LAIVVHHRDGVCGAKTLQERGRDARLQAFVAFHDQVHTHQRGGYSGIQQRLLGAFNVTQHQSALARLGVRCKVFRCEKSPNRHV
jgi:hypothetical protein